ncbi:DJ-1/PfpI family protein [Bacillus sp. 31A1R]|uniref:DJ-1/PfpI family protein n=1 Tax=Robertmurraya mangrovi TaxID=3098077 RepID=A0ABU5J0X2_9BACI|nr:DJ-1/PfpI family protein [Bacillus sp. 31A1R]MDZ5473005.1 DJ-1/PfpI family protein [Bacillus sp. 31A1R]
MKTYVFVYDGFAHFEAMVLGYIMNGKGHEVITVGSSNVPVKSAEGFRIANDQVISEVNVNDVDLFVVPGGNSYPAMGNAALISVIQQLHEMKKPIAAICHGPVLLAEAGVLEGKQFTSNVGETDEQFSLFKGTYVKEDVVTDDHFVTAIGNAYVEFAFKVAEKVNLFSSEDEANAYFNFFKNK